MESAILIAQIVANKRKGVRMRQGLRVFSAVAVLFLFVFPVWAADIAQMVGANFVFRQGGTQCSATLFEPAERWVLTNFHCVEDAIRTVEREEVQADGTVKKVTRVYYDDVTLSQSAYGEKAKVGELTLRAEILAFDRIRDLAVIRVQSETTPLPYAAKLLPDGKKLRQGQRVYAVGNPVGQENTISEGLINHLYREHRWSADQVAYYFQTDAVVAGGSSGGAVYDEEGFFIGVPSAGYRGTQVHFAIPIDVMKAFLRAHGFGRAWDSAAPTREEWLKQEKEKLESKGKKEEKR